ncbi:hypothetical protein NXX82_22730 [Bacteroides fragilis]|nr:hypothetical protein [Bacteroides fragilis]
MDAMHKLKSWSDPMHRLGEYAGDNMAKDKSSTDAFFDFISYSRDADNYRLQSFWGLWIQSYCTSFRILLK